MLITFLSIFLSITTRIAFAQLSLDPVWLPPDIQDANSTGWSDLLGNLLLFYDAQRSGQLSSVTKERVPWRNDSSLDDGSDVDLDLSGGFYDAGNYIKAIYPLSTTISSLSWGAINFGLGYQESGQFPWLDKTLRDALDWMINCHPENNTLYTNVGDVEDYYWGGDQNIPQPRASYRIDTDSPGTDASASTSAAFAASYLLYSGQQSSMTNDDWSSTSIQNQTFADSLLSHATALYDFAQSTEPTLYSVSVPEAAESYNSSRYEDSLVWSGLWLYLATNDTTYFDDALSVYWSSPELFQNSNQVFNWDSKIPAIYVLLTQIMSARPPSSPSSSNATLEYFQSETERYFDRIVIDGAGSDPDSQGITSYLTDGGLLWYPSDSSSASLNPALNAAMLLYQYAPLASTQNRTSAYQDFAQSQVDYALGINPLNRVYVVGVHPNSPQNPHSAPASGGSDIENIDDDPEQMAHVLYGGVVGGPDEQDRYYDIRSDWSQSEIALDYQHALITIAARANAINADPPAYVNVPYGSVIISSRGGSGLSGGQIAAAVILPILALIAAAFGIYWWKKGNPLKYSSLAKRY